MQGNFKNKLTGEIVHYPNMDIRDSLPKFSYEGLLFCLVVLFALIPIAEKLPFAQVIVKFGFTLVLLASVYMVSNKPLHALFAVVLAAPALVGHWLEIFIKMEIPHMVQLSFSMALQTYVAVIMLYNLFRVKTIDRSTLYGAVCIYIMIGLIFSSCYALIQTLDHDSFLGLRKVIAHNEISWGADTSPHQLFYFSFVTLTTLGYGQIAPQSVLASAVCSAEALIGQFYMTILVARLVALYVSSSAATVAKREEAKLERKIGKDK